jgi:hypothetical protein
MIPNEEGKIRYINEHFAYEVEELLNSLYFYLSVQARAKQLSEKNVLPVFVNASLEHTLLHARNLLEFYYYPKKKYVKANAWAYISSWQPPAKTRNVKELQARVNDEVTHLGWKRLEVRPEDKSWSPLGVISELLDVTAIFLAQLDRKFYGDGLKLLEDQMRQFRVKQHTVEGKRVLEYFDLFDFTFKSVSLN